MACNCKSKASQAQKAVHAQARREAAEISKLREQQAKEAARANAK